MPNDLQLSDQDEVLLESVVLAASDNVTRAPGADRGQFAPTRRRVFVETDGDENVYLGTGNAWVDVSENTGLLSSLFGGGDGNFDSVNTEEGEITDETFVITGYSKTDSSSEYASGTHVNIADAEVKDARGELNDEYQFAPDKTAYYRVSALAYLNGSGEYTLRIYNVTDDSLNAKLGSVNHVSNFTYVRGSRTVELVAGKAYEVQATDTGGSFGLIGDEGTTGFEIVKEVIQP